MAGPGVPGEGPEVRHHPRPEGVQVEVADELQEVGLRLDHDGLVPVLEEVPDPLVAAIERPGVAAQQGAHAPGEGAGSRPDQEVGVVRQARPGEDGEGSALRERRQAPDEVPPVGVVPEDGAALQAPHHHVMERVRRV